MSNSMSNSISISNSISNSTSSQQQFQLIHATGAHNGSHKCLHTSIAQRAENSRLYANSLICVVSYRVGKSEAGDLRASSAH